MYNSAGSLCYRLMNHCKNNAYNYKKLKLLQKTVLYFSLFFALHGNRTEHLTSSYGNEIITTNNKYRVLSVVNE